MSLRILDRKSHICTSLINYFDKTIINYYLGNMHVINCSSCKYMVCNKQLQLYLVDLLGAYPHNKENKSIFVVLLFLMTMRIILEKRTQTPNHGANLYILKVPAFEETKVACIPCIYTQLWLWPRGWHLTRRPQDHQFLQATTILSSSHIYL